MSLSNVPNITASLGTIASSGSLSPNMSGALTGIQGLPNPFTPLAFLPPDVARSYTVAMFVLTASLTILLWDILNCLRSDYILLTQHKIGLPTLVYLFSRVMNTVYLMGTVIVITAPIGNCRKWSIATTSLLPFSVPSTTLLLFFQVRAICRRNRALVFVCSIMWVVLVAAYAIQLMAATHAMEIGPTKYCILFGQAEPYSVAPAAVGLVYDTLMFVAIVHKVMQCSLDGSTGIKAGFKTFLSGGSLSTLCKALLQNGQAYFLSTVGLSFITVVSFYIGAIPSSYRIMLAFPDIALMNIMASRIFRNTKLGIFNLSTQPANVLNNQQLNRPQTGGVVVEMTRKLEKPSPSMETLNGTRMGVTIFRLKDSSVGAQGPTHSSDTMPTAEQNYDRHAELGV